MLRSPGFRLSLFAICGLYFSVFAHPAPAVGQAASPPSNPSNINICMGMVWGWT